MDNPADNSVIKTKIAEIVYPLVWDRRSKTASYASIKFGPETFYFDVSRVDEDLDIWSVNVGVHCSQHGPTEIHKTFGRFHAEEAAQRYYQKCVHLLFIDPIREKKG
jgi:hypothetical protein